MRKWMDLMICPENKDVLREMLKLSKKEGIVIKGICINENNKKKISLEDIKDIEDKNIFYLIEADSIKEFRDKKKRIMKSKISKGIRAYLLFSKKYDVLRYVVDKREIDALYNLPFSFSPFKVDQTLIKLASENNIGLIFDFSFFNSLGRKDKVIYLRNMRKVLQIAYKYNAMAIAISGAKNVYEIKHPRDLSSFFYVVYRNLPFSLKSTSDNVERFLDFIHKLHDPKRPLPGVYIYDSTEG